jgi:hypothetical protein
MLKKATYERVRRQDHLLNEFVVVLIQILVQFLFDVRILRQQMLEHLN